MCLALFCQGKLDKEKKLEQTLEDCQELQSNGCTELTVEHRGALELQARVAVRAAVHGGRLGS
jgi:hypothetical protein